MMLLEKPRISLTSTAQGGEPSTISEVADATFESELSGHTAIGRAVEVDQAYDRRIDTIKRETGEQLSHPLDDVADNRDLFYPPVANMEPVDDGGIQQIKPRYDPQVAFRKQLEDAAEKYPDKRDIIAPDRPIIEDAKASVRAKDKRATEVWERSERGALAWASRLGGGFYAAMHDPVNIGTLAIGGGPAQAGIKGLAWMALKQGAANAGAEAAIQPFVQSWRKEAGLDYGISQAALDIGMAGVFGAGLDAGVRGAVRIGRNVAGRPYLGPDPLPPVDALERAARVAPEGSILRKAGEGDAAAMRDLAKQAGLDKDPTVKHMLDEVENQSLFPAPENVDDGQHLSDLARAIREQSGAPELHPGDAIAPKVTRDVARLADEGEGAPIRIEDKPVSFRSVDPKEITTDATQFQFKSDGDLAGVTDRLRGVERWDPISAGKAIVFERADGQMVIADGHQRLGLAKRLADTGAKLDAYVFREADGWTPEDVRAYAALKNMRELSGSSIDMAKVMRERPDLIDGSLPLSDAKLREATMLGRLSNPAFDAVVAGRLPPQFAALIGESVPDAGRHAGLLDELAAANLQSVQQARLYLRQLLELPTTTETQMTLFGEWTVTRTVLLERTKVLDASLRSMKADKRIFNIVQREGGAITATNDRAAQLARAAKLADLIERLATSRGIVATILNDAATAVARGYNATLASRAFVSRIGDILEKEGIPGLLKGSDEIEPELSPRPMEEPNGPEALAQTEELQAQIDADQQSLFALKAYHSSPSDFDRFDSSKINTGERAPEIIDRIRPTTKIVGDDGQPLRLYHGTGAEFEQFDPSLSVEGGAFFASDPTIAADYTYRSGANKRVIEAYADIRNPKIVDAEGENFADAMLGKPSEEADGDRFTISSSEPSEKAKSFGDYTHGRRMEVTTPAGQKMELLVGVKSSRETTFRSTTSIDVTYDILSSDGKVYRADEQMTVLPGSTVDESLRSFVKLAMDTPFNNQSLPRLFLKQAVEQAKAEGYDGLWMRNGVDMGREAHDQIVAFRADQVSIVDHGIASLRNATLSAKATEQMAAIRSEIDTAVSRSLPVGWRADVRQRLVFGDLPENLRNRNRGVPPELEIEGTFDPYERIVYVSMAALDPVERAYEEAGHALKALRLIPEADYGILRAKAQEINAREKFKIDERYGEVYGARWKDDPARLESALEEEAIMQMVAARARGDDFGKASNTILDKILKFFRAVRDMLGVKGFRTFDDVFEDMTEGGFARSVDEGGAMPVSGEVMAANAGPGVMSTAFRRWFGASKIVDEGGKPLVVYHGGVSQGGIDVFHPGSHFGTQWQTEEILRAHNRIEQARAKAGMPSERVGDQAVYPVYLKIENPKRVDDTVSSKAEWQEIIDQAKAEGHDGLVYANFGEMDTDAAGNVLDSYVVFSPNQVKSATANRGTYDPNEPNIMLSFAGEKAETADKKALARAKEMAASGASRNDIWRETGWFKAADGKWRFEIDDSQANIDLNPQVGATPLRVQANTLGMAVDHQDLFAAYPDLANMKLTRSSAPGGGFVEGNNARMDIGPSTPSKDRKVLLHETQHAIQNKEGFARGGSPKEFTKEGEEFAKRARSALSWRRELARQPKGMDLSAKENAAIEEYRALDMMDFLPSKEARDLANNTSAFPDYALEYEVKLYGLDETVGMQPQRELYRRLAGEVEARNVEARARMTAEERRRIPPWETQEVSDEKQIGILLSPAEDMSSFASKAQAATGIMLSLPPDKGETGDAAKPAQGEKAKPKVSPRKAGQQIRDLINASAAEGKLSREDANALISRFDTLEKFHKDGGKAKEQLVKEIDAEAAHKKRQAALTEAARIRVEKVMTGFRDARGQPDPAKAMVVMLENLGQHELPEGTLSVVSQKNAIYGMALAKLDTMLHEFRPNPITGKPRNKARMINIIRELKGETTGDKAAADFAKASSDVMEDLRQRFNAAGGAIGKLDGWSGPQFHDPVALIRSGKDAWAKYITPLLDPSKMKHPLTGIAMSPADLEKSLSWIYDNIVSDGWHEKQPSMAFRGLGSIANQRGEHRFLVFKDAESWMRYSEMYGNGGDVLSTFVSHIRGMAEDIGAMEVFGPNPSAMVTYMQQFVEKQGALRAAKQPALFPVVTEVTGRDFSPTGWLARDPREYARRMNERATNMWNFYRGAMGAQVGDSMAEVSQTVRNWNVITKLGSATVSALTDPFWQLAARKFAGLPVTKTFTDVLKQIGTEREARRAGVISETYLHMHNEQAREAAALSATRVSGYLAERVISLSMLNTVTRAGNHAMAMSIQAHMADQAGKGFRELSSPIQRLLRRYGIAEGDWDAIRLDASGNPHSGDFLTPSMIYDAVKARGGDPRLAERYLAMALGEAQYATATGTLRAKAMALGNTRAGTGIGEIWRHLAQFKSFAVNIAILQIERVAREFVSQGLWRGAQYGAFALMSATLGGALVIQLKQLLAGKDPRDMTKPEFWGNAAYQSGGLSIWGDLLYASENRMGGGIAGTIAGPTASTIQGLANLTYGSASKALVGKPEEKTNFGRELAKTVRTNTPGSSLWYLRLAWNRVLMDNLQRTLDPEAETAFRRQMQNAKKDYRQGMWWRPGRNAPDRAPNLREAVPALAR